MMEFTTSAKSSRKLFAPLDNAASDTDADLGHISPLTSPTMAASGNRTRRRLLQGSLSDYILLEPVPSKQGMSTPKENLRGHGRRKSGQRPRRRHSSGPFNSQVNAGVFHHVRKPKPKRKLVELIDSETVDTVTVATSQLNKLALTSPQLKRRKQNDTQTMLDVGQKKFGAQFCNHCEMLFDLGDPEDELIHQRHHNSAATFKFPGWKQERVVANLDFDKCIVKITSGDPNSWWQKAKDVSEAVDKMLGIKDENAFTNRNKLQVYFYVCKKNIIGLLISEVIYDADNSHLKCGVRKLWSAANLSMTRNEIADALFDALRRNFMFGSFLEKLHIAMNPLCKWSKQYSEGFFKDCQ